MSSVKLESIIEKMKLENLTPELDISKIKITQPDINRPALQLAGYFEHFEATRLQVIGFVEYSYIEGLPEVDSIAITSTEKDFEDACDSDIRIAFNDRNIGKRVILWANEVDTDMLNKILYAVINKYYNVSKVRHWKTLWDAIAKNYYDNDNKFVGNVEVPVNALAFILMDYKEYFNLEN